MAETTVETVTMSRTQQDAEGLPISSLHEAENLSEDVDGDAPVFQAQRSGQVLLTLAGFSSIRSQASVL